MSNKKRKKPGKYKEFVRECVDLPYTLILPALTKAQNSQRQRENVYHRNPENWNMKEAHAALTTARRSANTKKQWQDPKFREMQQTDGKGVRGNIPPEVRRQWANMRVNPRYKTPDEFYHIQFLKTEIKKLSMKLGLDTINTTRMKLPELEDLYADLMQW